MSDITANSIVSAIVLCCYKGHKPTSLIVSEKVSDIISDSEHYKTSSLDGRNKFFELPVSVSSIDGFKIIV